MKVSSTWSFLQPQSFLEILDFSFCFRFQTSSMSKHYSWSSTQSRIFAIKKLVFKGVFKQIPQFVVNIWKEAMIYNVKDEHYFATLIKSWNMSSLLQNLMLLQISETCNWKLLQRMVHLKRSLDYEWSKGEINARRRSRLQKKISCSISFWQEWILICKLLQISETSENFCNVW